jgi:DNA-binding SARP family transcriptional activator
MFPDLLNQVAFRFGPCNETTFTRHNVCHFYLLALIVFSDSDRSKLNKRRERLVASHLEPYRETAYLLLMRAKAAAGNRAEALRTYERCRLLLSEDLGVSPSNQVENEYLAILRST